MAREELGEELYLRVGPVAILELVEAAKAVCSEAERFEERWSARDYELYQPLREALDQVDDKVNRVKRHPPTDDGVIV